MGSLSVKPGAFTRGAAGWDLIGRHVELEYIRQALAAPGTAGVVLFGEAGVGKTRLAREVLAGLEDAAIAWAPATHSAGQTPFGALAQILAAPVHTSTTPAQLHRELRQALMQRAAGRRLVLGIDDLHLLDEGSAGLVAHLVSNGDAQLVATVRSGEVAPGPVHALWQNGAADRIEVRPLTRTATERLLAFLLDGPVDRSTLDRIWTWCRGNPLLLGEQVRNGLEAGALVQDGWGMWTWRGTAALPGLGDAIDRRLGSLNPGEHRALEVLALAEPLEIDLLARLAAPASMATLERRGLLEIETERPLRRRKARLSHPLFGEALRSRSQPSHAAQIHREVAGAMATCGARRQGDVLRLAHHRLEGGAAQQPDILVQGAQQALALFDRPLAERLASAALEAGGGLAAGTVLGWALHLQGRVHEARACLAGIAALAITERERVDLTELRSIVLFWGLHRVDEAMGLVQRVAGQISSEGPRSELEARRAVYQLFSGRPDEAMAPAADVLAAAGATDLAKLHAATALAGAYAVRGRFGDAILTVESNLGRAIRLGPVFATGLGHLLGIRTFACRLAGRFREAEAFARQGFERSVAAGSHEGRALWGVLLGQALLGQGRVSEAVAWALDAAALLRDLDPIGFLPLALGTLAQAYAQAGDLEASASAVKDGEHSLTLANEVYRPEVGLGAVWLVACDGNLLGARLLALGLADAAACRGQRAAEAVALHNLIRLGDTSATTRDRLCQLVGSVDGPIALTFAAHATALALGDATALDAASRAFEQDCGALLLAAEAAATAAHLHTDPRRADAASRRSETLLQACPGAHPSWWRP